MTHRSRTKAAKLNGAAASTRRPTSRISLKQQAFMGADLLGEDEKEMLHALIWARRLRKLVDKQKHVTKVPRSRRRSG